jgi:hypothetical protein
LDAELDDGQRARRQALPPQLLAGLAHLAGLLRALLDRQRRRQALRRGEHCDEKKRCRNHDQQQCSIEPPRHVVL